MTELVEYGTEQGLQMTLTPSGTTSLTPERIDALADAGLRRMAVSLDGPDAESHDEFRQEEGSFEQTITAAWTAREKGPPLHVNTTVCAETVDDLPTIRDLVAELGAVLCSVFFLVPVGRRTVLDSIWPERAEDVMEWLAGVKRAADLVLKRPKLRITGVSYSSSGRVQVADRPLESVLAHRVAIARPGSRPATASHSSATLARCSRLASSRNYLGDTFRYKIL